MNEDGTMARLPQLMEFANKHDLKIATIADLIKYVSNANSSSSVDNSSDAVKEKISIFHSLMMERLHLRYSTEKHSIRKEMIDILKKMTEQDDPYAYFVLLCSNRIDPVQVIEDPLLYLDKLVKIMPDKFEKYQEPINRIKSDLEAKEKEIAELVNSLPSSIRKDFLKEYGEHALDFLGSSSPANKADKETLLRSILIKPQELSRLERRLQGGSIQERCAAALALGFSFQSEYINILYPALLEERDLNVLGAIRKAILLLNRRAHMPYRSVSSSPVEAEVSKLVFLVVDDEDYDIRETMGIIQQYYDRKKETEPDSLKKRFDSHFIKDADKTD